MVKKNYFQFEEFRILESNFKVNEEFDSSEDKILIDPEIFVEDIIEDNFIVVVGMKISGDKIPFSFEIKSSGIFSIEEGHSESNDLERVLHTNCAAMIFPFIREYIADLTRRAGFAPLLLRPVNFVAIYNEILKGKDKD